MRYVLDASVALAWYIPDEGNAYTRKLFEGLAAASILVPAIWANEMANALLVAERRQRVASADVDEFAAAISNLPIELEDTEVKAVPAYLGLGRKYRVTAYDAAYLGLALRYGLPLATIDSRLRTAASAAGVVLAA